MEIYKKLNKVKEDLRKAQIKPSGKNKFAGYTYLELQDFLPIVQDSLQRNLLFSRIALTEKEMTLYIHDIADTEKTIVEYSVPLERAEMRGLHPVQNLGATITYLKRYLYMLAFDISEHDALDSSEPSLSIEQVEAEINNCTNLVHLRDIFAKYQSAFTGVDREKIVHAKDKAKERLLKTKIS